MRRIWPDTLILLLLCAAAPLWLALAYGGHRAAFFAADALPVMLPTAGLHELEPLADRPDPFRWTTGSAQIRPPNPGGPLSLRLSLSSGLGRATPVVLRAGAGESSFFALPGLRIYSLLLPAQPGERVSLSIESPTEMIDGRALGVVFHTLSIAGDGPPPTNLIMAMLLATLGAYPLLRRAGMGRLAALAAVLALQMGAAAWQAAGLWRYAFLGQLLLAAGAVALGALAIGRRQAAGGRRQAAGGRRQAAGGRRQAAGGRRQAPNAASRLSPPASKRSERSASRHLPPALILLLLLALALCLPWLGAPDPVGDLKLSARRMGFMYERGGFSQAFTYGGDYMPLRLYILRGLSFLVGPLGGAFYDPVPAVTRALIKIPSILALLTTVALLYWWGLRHAGPRRAALIAGLYALIPPVWMNVAWWGQVDVLLALPMVASVALLDHGQGRWSWLCWAAGVLVKPQAIILAPLLYVLTLRRHGARGLAEGGALAAGLIGLACAPFVLIGEGPGLYQAAAGSVGRFPQVTNRAYNLWWLVAEDQPISDLVQVAGLSYRSIGFGLVALAAGLACLAALRRPGGPSRAAAAAALAMAFFALPTQIHERYAFFALPFLLLCAAADLRALVPFGLLTITATINIVGAIPGFFPEVERVIVRSAIPTAVAGVNMVILLGLLAFMWTVPEERWGAPGENSPLDQGAAALRAGDRARARALLMAAVRANPRSAPAWLWLAGALDAPAQQRECLERALSLDPGNAAARRGLEALGAGDSAQGTAHRGQGAAPALTTHHSPLTILLLAALGGAGVALTWAAWRGLGAEMGPGALLGLALLVGAPLGPAALVIGGVLLRISGRWLGGRGGAGSVRAGLSWAAAPQATGLLIWAGQLLLIPGASFGGGRATPGLALAAAICWGLHGLLGLASAALAVAGVATAHQISLWRSAAAWLLAALIVLGALAATFVGSALLITLRGG